MTRPFIALLMSLVAGVFLAGCQPEVVEIIDDDDPDHVDWSAATAYVFDSSVIPEIHITLTQEQWDQLLVYYDANHNTQHYVKCDCSFTKGADNISLKDCGLRLKGNTSRRRPQEGGKKRHVHFGLDFHYFEKDSEHTLKGLRKMDLKWFKDDPAYVREIYCYDLFRREGVWTAIRDVYARLWIRVGDQQETYYGVYGMMEHIDKNYVRTRLDGFGDKNGNLWKCRYGADLKTVSADMGIDDNLHDHVYELKTNKEEGFDAARLQLRDFIAHLNNLNGTAFDNWISSVMDVDLFLRTMAVNAMVGMWDDYWNNSNNYYLYFNSTNPSSYKVWFIPYDYDNTLGTSHKCGVQSDSGRQDPLNWGHSDYPLVTKILKNTGWKATYLRYLSEMSASGGNFYYTSSINRIKAWHSMITPFVSNDTGEDMTIQDRPASWGNHGEYRLLDPGSNNFFRVRSYGQ